MAGKLTATAAATFDGGVQDEEAEDGEEAEINVKKRLFSKDRRRKKLAGLGK